ncbi:MAG: phage distal tail protein [Ruminococcus sp.]
MLETVVTNPGNIRTPCMVEITPKVGMEQLTITGINRNLDTGENLRVVIRSLTANSTVILDGESGKITENGANKAADVDIWSLPILLPGETRITLDSTWTDMTVKYRPRFM